MRVAFVAFTRTGFALMRETAVRFAVGSDRVGDEIGLWTTRRLADEMGVGAFDDLGAWTGARFADSDALVFVGACGIAVRAIAPYVADKFSDPAVVSMDERGRVVAPLLSGHVGGGNDLARELAACTGGIAAVSTATDVEGVFAVDVWARDHGLAIVERDLAKEVSARLLEGEPIGFTQLQSRESPGKTVPETARDGKREAGRADGLVPELGVCVGVDAGARPFERTLHLVPAIATVGVGCRRGCDPDALEARVREVLAAHRIDPRAVRSVASIDLKRGEPAIAELARSLGCEALFYTAGELDSVEGEFSSSEFVRETVGTDNVCERAAVAGGGVLAVPKQAGGGVTVAVALDDFETEPPAGLVQEGEMDRENEQVQAAAKDRTAKRDETSEQDRGTSKDGTAARGRLSVVGLGPGAEGDMTLRAREVLRDCDAIVGYTVYVDLLKGEFPDKPFLSTPMRREVERCEMALSRAEGGEHVAMVCSGDPGVYGMAGLCYELLEKHPGVEIDVVPGVTAANGGAAVLGAALMHDFAVISLSDLMTPWETIERRLDAAARADFVICLYNPSSKKRADYLRRACDVLLCHKRPETVCGTVRNIGREGEEAHVMTLAELRDTQVDMFTAVFVGNDSTEVVDGHMVTPRGYLQRDRDRARGSATATAVDPGQPR